MKMLFAALAFAGLAGCASPTVHDYAGQKPAFDFKAYFNGRVDGWGMVQDRSGRVTKRMYVEMTGTWVGDVGTLDERFTHSDGTTETRVDGAQGGQFLHRHRGRRRGRGARRG